MIIKNRDVTIRNIFFWLKYKFFPKSKKPKERIVFSYLRKNGFLDGFENKRILEIGPKYGLDSILLATLKPKELVLIDLPSKTPMVKDWLPCVSSLCNTTYIEANILYMKKSQFDKIGIFDLIFCCGVLYHNVEQLRLLKKLIDLCNINGRVVIESATTRNKKLQNLNIVEIHWPKTYRDTGTITHLPSRYAIKSWLEMIGFSNVLIWKVYPKKLNRVRAVLTGVKTKDSKPYIYYKNPIRNPDYFIGNAT